LSARDAVGTCAGVCDRLRIPLDAEHHPLGSDKACGEKSYVASTGSEVENAHSSAEPCGAKEALGQRVKQGCLEIEAPLLSVAVLEHISLSHRYTSLGKEGDMFGSASCGGCGKPRAGEDTSCLEAPRAASERAAARRRPHP
jgi:hypothetical protein